MQNFDLPRRLAAEALGTGLLVVTVVGSGIMAASAEGKIKPPAMVAPAMAVPLIKSRFATSICPAIAITSAEWINAVG